MHKYINRLGVRAHWGQSRSHAQGRSDTSWLCWARVCSGRGPITHSSELPFWCHVRPSSQRKHTLVFTFLDSERGELTRRFEQETISENAFAGLIKPRTWQHFSTGYDGIRWHGKASRLPARRFWVWPCLYGVCSLSACVGFILDPLIVQRYAD